MDMNIKTAEANQWIEDVRTELACVALVLKQTKECLEHDPDDDIWFEYERIVKKVSVYWEGLTKAARTVCDIVKDVIGQAETVGKELVDGVKASEANLRG